MQQENSGKLLEECRELMTNRMRSSMARMMGHVEEVLFEMATVDSSTDEAAHYIEAVREIRMKKREIQVRFENRFMSLYQDSVRQMKSGRSRQQSASEEADTVFGVVFQNSDDAVSIKNTLDKARNECRQALSILDEHVSTLFEKEDIDKFINPMQPVTVFGAFWESCRDIRAGADIRYILVDMFEKYVVEDLHYVYDDLNNLFGFYNLNIKAIPDTNIEGEKNGAFHEKPNDKSEDTLNQKSCLISSWVKSRLHKQIEKHEIPGFIQQFILGSWVLVLEDIFERASDKSHEWDRAMQVVDELIRCTQLAGDRESRTQQIWMLPGLIYRLKSGMRNVSVPLKTQADFLSELKAYHILITEQNLEKAVN